MHQSNVSYNDMQSNRPNHASWIMSIASLFITSRSPFCAAPNISLPVVFWRSILARDALSLLPVPVSSFLTSVESILITSPHKVRTAFSVNHHIPDSVSKVMTFFSSPFLNRKNCHISNTLWYSAYCLRSSPYKVSLYELKVLLHLPPSITRKFEIMICFYIHSQWLPLPNLMHLEHNC